MKQRNREKFMKCKDFPLFSPSIFSGFKHKRSFCFSWWLINYLFINKCIEHNKTELISTSKLEHKQAWKTNIIKQWHLPAFYQWHAHKYFPAWSSHKAMVRARARSRTKWMLWPSLTKNKPQSLHKISMQKSTHHLQHKHHSWDFLSLLPSPKSLGFVSHLEWNLYQGSSPISYSSWKNHLQCCPWLNNQTPCNVSM